jgi:hypothetical protein
MSSFFRNSGSAGFLPKHMIAGAIHGGGGGREGSWGSLGWLAVGGWQLAVGSWRTRDVGERIE